MNSTCLALARSKDVKDNFEAELRLTVRRARTDKFQDLYSVYVERILPNPNYSKTYYNGHNKEIAIDVFHDVMREGQKEMNYVIERDWTTPTHKAHDFNDPIGCDCMQCQISKLS